MMNRNNVYKIVLAGIIFYTHPLYCAASEGNPEPRFDLKLKTINAAFADTVPELKKPTAENPVDKPAELIIKEVPKSRKQLKPIAVTSGIVIKPVRIIKPKIIKPVIKIH